MAAASKLRLSVLLLFLQLLFYLYVLPRGNGASRQEDPGGGYLLSRACRLSYPPSASSPSGHTFFLQLAENCGIRVQKPERHPAPPPPPTLSQPEVAEPQPVEICHHPEPEVDQSPVSKEPEEDTNRSGNLIYQIIMVLLFLSVSFALADCFQERAKKRANPDRHDGLSRRMSLADLTMSRHARRESQASYRPIGKPRPEDDRFKSCRMHATIKTKSLWSDHNNSFGYRLSKTTAFGKP
nr:uncharacterized protein LOC106688873 isoform X2 [Halyomorpha halys]